MSILTLSDLKLSVMEDESKLLALARKKLGREPKYFAIKKKSLDARDKNNLRYVYTVECSAKPYKEETPSFEKLPAHKLPKRKVLVVGSGPAGLFCALRLLDYGICPLVIERGAPVDEREKSIQLFCAETQARPQFQRAIRGGRRRYFLGREIEYANAQRFE